MISNWGDPFGDAGGQHKNHSSAQSTQDCIQHSYENDLVASVLEKKSSPTSPCKINMNPKDNCFVQ